MKNWTPKDIKDLRTEYRLSQPAFGEILGVSGNYIYLLESGVKKPSTTLKILLGYIERELVGKEKGGEKKHGKGNL